MQKLFREKILPLWALLIASFYFLATALAVETILSMFSELVSVNIFVIMFLSIFSIVALAVIFLFYYVARYIEEKIAKKSNVIVKALFYYIIPTGFYLFLIIQDFGTLPIVVIILALVIRQFMELLFRKMYANK